MVYARVGHMAARTKAVKRLAHERVSVANACFYPPNDYQPSIGRLGRKEMSLMPSMMMWDGVLLPDGS